MDTAAHHLTLREFATLLPLAANGAAARRWATTRRRPTMVGTLPVGDDTLNALTFGDYIALATCADDAAFIATAGRIVGVDLAAQPAAQALGFIGWLARGVGKITKMFAAVRIPPTADERQAGVDTLTFGFFGIVDWYARRMGCTHAAAEATPWVRVYKCLDMETKTALYERRLMEVRVKKQQKKVKRR